MNLNCSIVEKTIAEISFIHKLISIEEKEYIISGEISILFEELSDELYFRFEIFPQYPLKRYGQESIHFFNVNLINYNHVMGDGSICIHMTHSIDVKQKLISDFYSLKQWIQKYYINKENDTNYEHIIVPEIPIKDKYYSFLFTQLECKFEKGDFGTVTTSHLNESVFKNKKIENLIVKNFTVFKGRQINCDWSKSYLNLPSSLFGFYIYVKEPPAKNNRFAFQYWTDFQEVFPSYFIDALYRYEKSCKKENIGTLFPVFIGYHTIKAEIHWQVAILEIGKFPVKGIPETKNGIKTGNWFGNFTNDKIKWAITNDSSYKNFYGRGALNQAITESKILIIGIGAIGSMIAKILTNGGCRYIDVADYDIKYPENVCRSEYFFVTGIGDKVEELKHVLFAVSPFLEMNAFNKACFEDFIKSFYNENPKFRNGITSLLNKYDIIFDCTTDDDLMFVLNSLELECNLINLSITNHAKHLICAFHPNIYHFVQTQINTILEHNSDDLYEPIGCWSPTFKASYTDINSLVQIAVKKINGYYKNNKTNNNFIVFSNDDDRFTIRVEEY